MKDEVTENIYRLPLVLEPQLDRRLDNYLSDFARIDNGSRYG